MSIDAGNRLSPRPSPLTPPLLREGEAKSVAPPHSKGYKFAYGVRGCYCGLASRCGHDRRRLPMTPDPIAFEDEPRSNAVRRTISNLEPRALRTFTPTQAVLARSAGIFHWTPEG